MRTSFILIHMCSLLSQESDACLSSFFHKNALQLLSGMRSIYSPKRMRTMCARFFVKSLAFETTKTGSTCLSGTVQRDIILCTTLLGQKGVDSTCWLNWWVLGMTVHSAAWLITMVDIHELSPSYKGMTSSKLPGTFFFGTLSQGPTIIWPSYTAPKPIIH